MAWCAADSVLGGRFWRAARVAALFACPCLTALHRLAPLPCPSPCPAAATALLAHKVTVDTTIGAEAVRDLAAGGATSFAAGGQLAPVCASRWQAAAGGRAGGRAALSQQGFSARTESSRGEQPTARP